MYIIYMYICRSRSRSTYLSARNSTFTASAPAEATVKSDSCSGHTGGEH